MITCNLKSVTPISNYITVTVLFALVKESISTKVIEAGPRLVARARHVILSPANCERVNGERAVFCVPAALSARSLVLNDDRCPALSNHSCPYSDGVNRFRSVPRVRGHARHVAARRPAGAYLVRLSGSCQWFRGASCRRRPAPPRGAPLRRLFALLSRLGSKTGFTSSDLQTKDFNSPSGRPTESASAARRVRAFRIPGHKVGPVCGLSAICRRKANGTRIRLALIASGRHTCRVWPERKEHPKFTAFCDNGRPIDRDVADDRETRNFARRRRSSVVSA
ncbi:hypothetical protein EVAR_84798_1 [Eumeta japonica]|uniref:Uncharacterized protein n=1 Tax=Eumeta variegata TaxID=151549 RepID=A0A4C1U8B1_EUMVA|nr:hypothetical protein EVAR_84798_1 [Eumeta japonica]